MKILILGANGFIGYHLTQALLQKTKHEVLALDIADNNIRELAPHPRLTFHQEDMLKNTKRVETLVAESDIVFPLVAIALPSTYVNDPLRIFNLDFEANLAIVRLCVKYQKRIIFPSTSEVYGMCEDSVFDEENSNLVLGPINKPRWIYSCCKQLLDRIISAHGDKDGLVYTLFRPFNWVGPRLDNITNLKAGGSRVITQFLGNILRGEPIQLVGGGLQQRAFTFIDDGIDALLSIIETDKAHGKIINIGNPHNNISIAELAERILHSIAKHPKYHGLAEQVVIQKTEPATYYGAGYQDVQHRVPAIEIAKQTLGWTPSTDMNTLIDRTVFYYLETYGETFAKVTYEQ